MTLMLTSSVTCSQEEVKQTLLLPCITSLSFSVSICYTRFLLAFQFRLILIKDHRMRDAPPGGDSGTY